MSPAAGAKSAATTTYSGSPQVPAILHPDSVRERQIRQLRQQTSRSLRGLFNYGMNEVFSIATHLRHVQTLSAPSGTCADSYRSIAPRQTEDKFLVRISIYKRQAKAGLDRGAKAWNGVKPQRVTHSAGHRRIISCTSSIRHVRAQGGKDMGWIMVWATWFIPCSIQ